MPRPAKKRRVELPEKIGKIRQYLMDNFRILPDELNKLKNGHILLLHINNDRSVGKTIKAVVEKLPCMITPAQLQSLLNRSKKFTTVARDSDMKNYSSLCCESYTSFDPVLEEPHPVLEDPQPGPSELQPEPETPLPSGPKQSKSRTPGSSVRSTPQHLLSPRKLKMKKRLEFVSQSRSSMKERHANIVKKLQSQIDTLKLHKIKYLNQELTRKKLSIAKRLCIKFSNKCLAKDLAEMKTRYKNAKRNNKCLRKKNEEPVSNLNNEADFLKLKDEVKSKNDIIRDLENDKLCLEEKLNYLEESSLQKPGKTYSLDMRMFVYDAIVNNVPTKNIPLLIKKYANRSGITLDKVPHRTTVELMTRELGVISDFQAAEILLDNENLTLGFDATTQTGLHVNSVHVTSNNDCHVLAVDQLPGGTAEDYELHITESLDCLTDVYCKFYCTNFEESRQIFLAHISNTMTDRATVNHATIHRLELNWRKHLNELNCHLHPLDTIASSVRTALKSNEPPNLVKKLWF